MLPSKLAEVKLKLMAKGYTARTTDEDALLEELDRIDSLLEDNTIRKSANFSESRMTGAPSGRCACCGR